jgi:formylglycine-generating enzyme required for sulfatase activity
VEIVRRWTGRDARALREAKRMSVREFAAHLGVTDRMVSKWEAGGENLTPRPVNQAALDTSLGRCMPAELEKFELFRAQPQTDLEQAERTEGDSDLLFESGEVTHPIDGKAMTLVEAGTFLCGSAGEPTWLPAFYIDVFPTTNADYARFIAATGHRPPMHWTESGCPDDELDHPVVFVTWHDASAYAFWAGKALPTAKQWEKAARGPKGNVYPWGSRPTPAKCNVREGRIGATTPKDRYSSGVSPYGVYDLCGNVWEWCSTETEPGRYELKGSAFTSSFERAAPSRFNDASSEMYDDDTGFRCVAAAEVMERLLRVQ